MGQFGSSWLSFDEFGSGWQPHWPKLAQIGSNCAKFAQIGSQISSTIERCPLKQRAGETKKFSFRVTFRNAWLKRRAEKCLLTQKSNVTLPQTAKVLVIHSSQIHLGQDFCQQSLLPGKRNYQEYQDRPHVVCLHLLTGLRITIHAFNVAQASGTP